MSVSRLRGAAAILLIPSLAAAAMAAAGPASASSPGIRKPTLSVVCGQPHHARSFTAVAFKQRGSWAANGHVTITVTRGDSLRTAATIETTTDAAGDFRVDKVLVRKHARPWRAGATYRWTTEIAGDSWLTARTGTVVLSGTC
jgi:hypothetical protein